VRAGLRKGFSSADTLSTVEGMGGVRTEHTLGIAQGFAVGHREMGRYHRTARSQCARQGRFTI
jgi:hypothetical protein